MEFADMAAAFKTERLELRLDSAIVGRLDAWRSDQADLPGRSEAIRRLIDAGLGDSATRRTYVAMKLQILSVALTRGTGPKAISDAYLYAWSNDVYPIMHENLEWHKPFTAAFSVSPEMMDDLSQLLDESWRKKKPLSFYKLEDHYELRLGQSDWTRVSLMQACRYMYLEGAFDQEFWTRILRRGDHPLEAGSITREFDRTEVTIG
jgi:antitoxin MazE